MLDTIVLEDYPSRCRETMNARGKDQQAAQDARAVQQVLAGNSDAFRELYARYVRLIRAVCHDFTHNSHRTQDLVHEVFLKAYRKLGRLRRPESFGPWLLKIARHTCHDWQRSAARDRHVYVGLEPDMPESNDEQADIRLQPMLDALTKLPERERLAIHLAYLEEQPAEHARRLLGLSRSGYYRLLERTRAKLERLLQQDLEANQ